MQGSNVSLKRAFGVLSVAMFVAMLGLGIISPLMADYADTLGATGTWLGAIFAGFNVSRSIIMPVVGRLSDAWGRRKLFLALGMVFFGLASIGYVLSSEAIHLFIGRFLQGFGAGMVLPISMAYVGDMTPKGKEGTYTGIINVARTMGWGCGPLIGGYLMEAYGIDVPFYVMGGLALVSCILVLTALPEYTKSRVEKPEISYRTILRDKTIRSLVLYRAINAIGTGNLFSFFPLLAESLGISPTEVGILLSSRILVMSLLQGPFGALADRYDAVKLILVSGSGSAILLLLVPFSRNFVELLAVGLLIGGSWAVLMPATTAMAAKSGREHGMASVMSTVNVGFSVGMIIGPLTSGLIKDLFDIYAVFYFGGSIAVVGIVLFYLLIRWKA